MLIDTRELAEDSVLEADICIIGAGIAGLSIAHEFINNNFVKKNNLRKSKTKPRRIMILESGGETSDERTQQLYSGKFQLHDYAGQKLSRDSYLTSSRFRCFGGSGNHWGGRCLIPDDADFKKREWLPNSGWPFAKKDLNKYYERACKRLRIPSFDYDIFKTNDFKNEKSAAPYVIGEGQKVTTKMMHYSPLALRNGDEYNSFKQNVAKSKHIQVYLHANATGLQTNSTGETITGVTVKCFLSNLENSNPNNGAKNSKLEKAPLNNSGNLKSSYKSIKVKAKKYILATGGIENARLLLLSNRTHRKGVGNRHGHVGRYFMEHLWFSDMTHLYFSRKKDLGLYEEHTAKLLKQEQIRRGVFSLNTKTRTEKKLMNFIGELSVVRREGSELFRSVIHSIYDTDHFMDADQKKDFFKGHLRGFRVAGGEKSPDSKSRLRLSNETDELGQRKVDLTMRINKSDYKTIEDTLKILALELGRTGEGRLRWPGFFEKSGSRQLKKNNPDRNLQKSDFLKNVGLPCHHMGTTRMDIDPLYGVVDENCRVHGISNLYIAGSSVFPTSGFANPTLTITALAIRLADHLKGGLW